MSSGYWAAQPATSPTPPPPPPAPAPGRRISRSSGRPPRQLAQPHHRPLKGSDMSTNALAPGTGDVAAASGSGTPLATSLVVIAATVLTGLATGVIALYAHTIMPGLKKTDDRTFVNAYQNIDRAIINPWFMTTFFGALILIGIAALMHLGAARRGALPWLAAALVLYLIGVVITM